MNFRRVVLVVLVPFLLVCAASAAPLGDVPARIHWLGLDQISADTNAAHFLSVWRLPQSQALVAQTLDKLSRWPVSGATNAAGALLRPLLDDLISNEFYLEIPASTNLPLSAAGGEGGLSAPSNHPASSIQHPILLAVRLPADRARLWQTNLAGASNRVECSLGGDWTLVGVGLDEPVAKTEFAARLARHHTRSGSWLEADLAPSLLTNFFSLSAPGRQSGSDEGWGEVANPIYHLLSAISRLHLTISGEAGNVHTSGTLDFSRPFQMPLPSWDIPTNFIHSELTSFTAVRGFAPWLAALPGWQKLQLAPAPDQAYLWSHQDLPFLTTFAAPLPAVSNQLSQLAGRLVPNVNPWLVNYADGFIHWQTNLPGVAWSLPIICPFLKPVRVNRQDWLLGGLFPQPAGGSRPAPAEILRAVRDTPGLVYYQSEDTRLRMPEAKFVTQMFRLVFQKAKLPPNAVAAVWLQQIEPLLGDSTTAVTRAGPAQLSLVRHSTLGLTAFEFHLLADWLESPQFPRGLHTFLAPPDN